MIKTNLCLEQTLIEPLLPRRPPAGDPQLSREVGINAQTHTTAGATNLPKHLLLEEDNVAVKIFTLPPPLQRWNKRVKHKWPGKEAVDVRMHSLSQAVGCLIHVLIKFSLSGACAKLRKVTISFVMSARLSVRPPAWNNSAPTGRIFMKFDIWGVFEKSIEKIQVSSKSDKNNGCFIWTPI